MFTLRQQLEITDKAGVEFKVTTLPQHQVATSRQVLVSSVAINCKSLQNSFSITFVFVTE